MKSMLLILALLCVPIMSKADIVRYIDGDGKTHYVDSEEKVPEQYKDQLRDAKPLPNITKTKNPLFKYNYRKSSSRSGKASVELFVTSWCGYCRALEASLRKQGIAFKKYDIEESPKAKKIYDSLGGGGIPITRVGEKIIRGNRPEQVIAALKAAS